MVFCPIVTQKGAGEIFPFVIGGYEGLNETKENSINILNKHLKGRATLAPIIYIKKRHSCWEREPGPPCVYLPTIQVKPRMEFPTQHQLGG